MLTACALTAPCSHRLRLPGGGEGRGVCLGYWSTPKWVQEPAPVLHAAVLLIWTMEWNALSQHVIHRMLDECSPLAGRAWDISYFEEKLLSLRPLGLLLWKRNYWLAKEVHSWNYPQKSIIHHLVGYIFHRAHVTISLTLFLGFKKIFNYTLAPVFKTYLDVLERACLYKRLLESPRVTSTVLANRTEIAGHTHLWPLLKCLVS